MNGPAVVGRAGGLGSAEEILASISARRADRVCLTVDGGVVLSLVMLPFLRLQAAVLWYQYFWKFRRQ